MGLLGFEFEPPLPDLTAVDDNPGILLCLLYESSVAPVVSTAQVRNAIDVGHKGESGYVGHDANAIRSLFPRIQLLRATQPLDQDSVWRVFLRLCAFECGQGGSWIEDELSSELVALTDLNVPELPYRALCRSMFDLDPRGLFMALYRCVEATYAYESCRKLVEALGVSKAWQDLAGALEKEIGWHPAEAASLNLILQHAHSADLEQLCECLNAEFGADLVIRTGRAIYGLRNRIVHYRLGMQTVDVEQYDWNRICVCLIRVVYSIFARVHLSPSTPT